MRASRGFLCALAGVAVTILAWFGPWAWPAWPAFAVMYVAFGPDGSFDDLAYNTRAAIIVALIAVNVACWGLAAYGAMRTLRRSQIQPGNTPPDH